MEISNLRINVNRPVGSALTHADRRTDSLIPFHWRSLIWRFNFDSSNGICHGWAIILRSLTAKARVWSPVSFVGDTAVLGRAFCIVLRFSPVSIIHQCFVLIVILFVSQKQAGEAWSWPQAEQCAVWYQEERERKYSHIYFNFKPANAHSFINITI